MGTLIHHDNLSATLFGKKPPAAFLQPWAILSLLFAHTKEIDDLNGRIGNLDLKYETTQQR